MVLKQFIVGAIQTNCYLAACEETREAFIVDPDLRRESEKEGVIGEIDRGDLKVKYIINTHFHADHTGGNEFLTSATGAELLVHEKDAAWLPASWKSFEEMIKQRSEPVCPACGGERATLTIARDGRSAVVGCESCDLAFELLASPPADRLLHDDDTLHVGNLEILVLHTPGHSRGGISLYLEKEGILFSGDTLFRRSIGRTDLLEGSYEDIISSLKKLMKLPEETVVFPGHGERTTIGEEKRENPYLA